MADTLKTLNFSRMVCKRIEVWSKWSNHIPNFCRDGRNMPSCFETVKTYRILVRMVKAYRILVGAVKTNQNSADANASYQILADATEIQRILVETIET